MIIRTYFCLNIHCKNEWNSTDDHPPCPRCGGLRVKWLPKPVAIVKQAPFVDRTVRDLADAHGLTNINSPVAGQRAAPTTVSAPSANGSIPFEPVPGWKVDLPRAVMEGNGQAFCAPTGMTAPLRNADYQFVDKPGKPTMIDGKRLDVGAKVEASWRPPGGIPQGD